MEFYPFWRLDTLLVYFVSRVNQTAIKRILFGNGIITDIFLIRGQPLFHTEKLEKSLFLAFEIESNIMICGLKPPSVQRFVKNPILAYRIQCIIITCSFSLSFMQQCEKSQFNSIALRARVTKFLSLIQNQLTPASSNVDF